MPTLTNFSEVCTHQLLFKQVQLTNCIPR